MGFPAGMQLATVAFGIPLTATGKDVVTKVTVKPTSRVIWAATGQPLPEFSDSFTAEAGQLGQFQVPFVDQAGFIDSTGATVTDFAYQISASWEFGNERPIAWSKNLKPLLGQSAPIDLDLVPDGPVTIPVTAPTAAVLGFGGRTGFVTLQESDLPSRLSEVELSATTATAIEAAAKDPAGVVVRKAKDVQGGAFPAPLRAPVLTIEKAWPNRDADYRILWTENAGQTLYAIGYDNGIRKSTDGGTTWTYKGLQGFGANMTGAFLKLASGTLLMMRPGTPAAIQRSTDDGVTWTSPFNTTTVPPSRTSAYGMGVQSWSQDPVTGAVYYGEYDTSDNKTDLLVYRSTDDGATWPIFYTFPGHASTDANKVRHLHSIDYDPIMGRMIFMLGDSAPAAGLYRTTADGTSLEPLLLNRDVPSIMDGARAIGIIPFPDYLCWTGDSTGNPYLMRMARSEIGKANPVVERVYRLNSTGWFTIRASDDGTRWVFSASPENTGIRIDRAVHLYSVEDQGKTIYEVGALAIPSTATGLSAVAPVGQARIHGDMMFLQAHSAGRDAVWKAQLAKGTTQLAWPAESPTAYLPTTVNSGAVDLGAVPNNTQVFAHTRAPYFAKKLHIFEMGVAGQSGDVGNVRIRAKKKSDGTVLLSSAVSSERAQRRAEAGGPILSIDMTAADDIEFEVYLSAAGTARCTATVTYGFGR